MQYILEINQFVLPMSIGAEAEERSKPQDISFKIVIEFGSKPLACESNDISDAVCYVKLVEEIERFCLGKEFYLIEQLANEIHNMVKASLLSPMDKLSLTVYKDPPVEKIKGNCCFTVAD
jgi:7,8-dihydroneopterin aldolase/epimerase/oxygenase|tara:strand:- start:8 stop:367 length:360 start_codon:yes stop_codon:yes gene_type:complete